MTLNDKIGGFMNFLAILGCETLSLQERIAPKSVEIDMDK